MGGLITAIDRSLLDAAASSSVAVVRAHLADARAVLAMLLEEHLVAVLEDAPALERRRLAELHRGGRCACGHVLDHSTDDVCRHCRKLRDELVAAAAPAPWPATERRSCKYCGDEFEVVPELDDDGPNAQRWCSTACRKRGADS
jgi:hypothetical protein